MNNVENIFSKGCLIKLSISKWAGRVKIPSRALLDGSAHADVDPRFVGAHKRLVDGDSLKEIERAASDARAWLYSRSLPFPIDGAVFVPTAEIVKIDERLAEYRARFEAAADAFAADFSAIRDKASERLGSLFDPSDYPTDIRDRFGFRWQPLVVSAPGETQLLDPALVKRANEEFERLMHEATTNATNALRARFAECIDHMVKRLSGERENGKPMIFRESLVTNLKEYISSFANLNVTNDQDLAALVTKATEAIDGVEAQELRDDAGLRGHVAAQMATVQAALDGMMVDRPTRKLRFGKADATPAGEADAA